MIAFCGVNGEVRGLGGAVGLAVASAAAQGVSVLYVADTDVEQGQREADKRGGGLKVRGVTTAGDLLAWGGVEEQGGLWVAEA